MNIIFFGNTRYSAIDAEILHKNLKLAAVVTIPDQILGRKKELTPSPVKQFALKNNIPVIEAKQCNNVTMKQLENYKPDFFVVADYGLILPSTILALPKIAALNVHHSLLPKYRGPSPAPSAILAGEKTTGVTIIKMANDVDAGDILAQEKYDLKPDETTDSLLTKLNQLGGKLVTDVILRFESLEQTVQDESLATFTNRMKKEDGFINLENPPSPEHLDRMIRAYYPWPTVWTRQIINSKSSIIKFLPQQKIHVQGKKPVSVKDFLNGYPKLRQQLMQLGLV